MQAAPVDAEAGGVWQQLLQRAARQHHVQQRTLVVLGDRSCGKDSIIRKFCELTGSPEPESRRGAVLEYVFMDAIDPDSRDAERDVLCPKFNVWMLHDPHHAALLQHVVTPSNIEHLVFIIVLDLTKPWSLMRSLSDWIGVAKAAAHAALQGVSGEKRVELLESWANRVRAYRDPQQGVGTPSGAGEGASPRAPAPALPPGVLTDNIGAPLIVIGSKSDVLKGSAGAQASGWGRSLDRHDFVLRHVRARCLPYAGALAFVSARLGTNCQRLLRYILHACNLPAGLPKPGTAASEGAGAGSGAGAGTGAAGSGAGSYLTPVLRDRDALFLPAGADTLALVNDLRAGQGEEADRPFEAVVPPPPAADTEAEEDDLVEALEEAAFLRSLQEPKAMAAAARAAARAGGRPGAGQRFETGSPALALAASPVPASMRTATPPASLPSGSGSRHLGAGGGVPLAGKRGGSGGGGAEAGVPQNQEAIASFFQGLLSRSNSGVPDATARRAPAARRGAASDVVKRDDKPATKRPEGS